MKKLKLKIYRHLLKKLSLLHKFTFLTSVHLESSLYALVKVIPKNARVSTYSKHNFGVKYPNYLYFFSDSDVLLKACLKHGMINIFYMQYNLIYIQNPLFCVFETQLVLKAFQNLFSMLLNHKKIN